MFTFIKLYAGDSTVILQKKGESKGVTKNKVKKKTMKGSAVH